MHTLIRSVALGSLVVALAACGDERWREPSTPSTSALLDGVRHDEVAFEARAQTTDTGLSLRYLATVDVAPGAIDDEIDLRVDVDLALVLLEDLPFELTVALDGEASVDPKNFTATPYELDAPTVTSFVSYDDEPHLQRAALLVLNVGSLLSSGPFVERVNGTIHFDELSATHVRGQLVVSAVGLEQDDTSARDHDPLFRAGVRLELPFDLAVQR
jgi:hypothetical protein